MCHRLCLAIATVPDDGTYTHNVSDHLGTPPGPLRASLGPSLGPPWGPFGVKILESREAQEFLPRLASVGLLVPRGGPWVLLGASLGPFWALRFFFILFSSKGNE